MISSERPNSNHRFSEELVADESVVDVVIFLLATPLLKLICRVVFFATRCLPVPVTVWPALPDVKGRDREEIQHGRDVLLVLWSYHLARSVRTCSRRCQRPQYVRHALHCAFGSTSTISHSSVFLAALIASFDSLLKGLNARCC